MIFNYLANGIHCVFAILLCMLKYRHDFVRIVRIARNWCSQNWFRIIQVMSRSHQEVFRLILNAYGWSWLIFRKCHFHRFRLLSCGHGSHMWHVLIWRRLSRTAPSLKGKGSAPSNKSVFCCVFISLWWISVLFWDQREDSANQRVQELYELSRKPNDSVRHSEKWYLICTSGLGEKSSEIENIRIHLTSFTEYSEVIINP